MQSLYFIGVCISKSQQFYKTVVCCKFNKTFYMYCFFILRFVFLSDHL